jgi:hypothetical protein
MARGIYNRPVRIVSALVLALITVFVAGAAGAVRDQLWVEYTRFTSPFVTSPPAGEPATQHTRRMIVVLVRGLRTRDLAAMPALTGLGARGAAYTMTLDAPTYALPAWLTLFSGATHQIHGTTADASPRNASLDTVFARLRVTNQSAAIIGTTRWNELYGADAARVEVIESDDAGFHDEQAANAIQQTLRDPSAPERLIVAELRLLNASRNLTDTAAVASAIAATDIRINAIAQAADLANNTLIVLSDHGATDDGRFGGAEPDVAQVPLLLTGAGIVTSVTGNARATDLAPSMALLLGLPPPLHAQGTPIWDAIASKSYLASARQLTAFYESWSEAARQPRFAAEVLRAHESAIASGDRARYALWREELARAASAQREARLAAEAQTRLPVLIGAAVLMLAIGLVALNHAAGATLAGIGVYAVGWFIWNWVVRSYNNSLSQFVDADPTSTIAALAFDAGILTASACAVSAIVAARVADGLGAAIGAVAGTTAWIAIGNAAGYTLFFRRWGDAFTWTLPDATELVDAMFALTRVAALNIKLIDALPELPIVIPAMLVTAIAWLLIGQRENSEE